MKAKVLYLIIVLVTVFSLVAAGIALSPAKPASSQVYTWRDSFDTEFRISAKSNVAVSGGL